MRWFRDVRIQVAGLVLVSLALSACGRTGIKVSSSAQPTAAPGAPTLIVRLDGRLDDRGVVTHTADYLSDGTVIRWAPGPACEPGRPCGTLESNSLTTAGLAALHALLAEDADLLAEPTNLTAQMRPGESRSGRSDVINTFVLERPDRSRYTVSAPSARSFNAAGWAPDPAIERLNALAEFMRDPETLVGREGLAHAWTVYRPAKMAVFVRLAAIAPAATPTVGKDGTIGMPFPTIVPHDISQSWPFESKPDTFGTAFARPDGSAPRCGFVDSADVETLAAIIPASAGGTLAAGELAMGMTWGSGGLGWGDKTYISLRIVALLPEDVTASCADALAY